MKPSPANYCERCSQLLKGEIVWLELSITDSRYYKTIPAGHKSQGLFAFCADCAERVEKVERAPEKTIPEKTVKSYPAICLRAPM